MSTQTLAAPTTPRHRSQTSKAVRLQLVDVNASTYLPWLIMASSFVINVLVFVVAGDAIPRAHRNTGALSSLYIVAMVANLQTWTQVFPFALGLSLTRGAFIRGAGLLAVGQSVVAGAILVLLKTIEGATGGWGIGMKFFAVPYVARDNPFAQFLVYAVPYLALCCIGMVLGVVFKRWGQTGMYTLAVGGILVVGGAVVLVTWRDRWGDLGRFFTETDPMLLLVGYPALIAAVMAGLAFLTVRRATP